MYRTDERGFTILELVVAMAFLGIVIVSLTNLFTAVRQINLSANNYTIATQVAQQTIETYRNTAYSGISTLPTNLATALAPYPNLHSATGTAVLTTTAGGLTQVDVKIQYTERNIIKRVQLSTQIANRGLNK